LNTSRGLWKLQRIWDHFLVHGWKSIFKIVILIFKKYEEELLTFNYDEMLPFIGNLPEKFFI